MLVEHLPRDSAYHHAKHGSRALPTTETVWGPLILHTLNLGLWAQADPDKRGPMPARPATPFDPEPRAEPRIDWKARLEDLQRRDEQRRGVS